VAAEVADMAARKGQVGKTEEQSAGEPHAMNAPISAKGAALDSKKKELLDHKSE
jgi:hypothetical protein